jgi:hypothetical protein
MNLYITPSILGRRVGISSIQNILDKRIHEMKRGLQNYVVILPIENTCIKVNNNKINSLQRCDTAQNYRIRHKVMQRMSQHNLEILNYRHIQKLRQRK